MQARGLLGSAAPTHADNNKKQSCPNDGRRRQQLSVLLPSSCSYNMAVFLYVGLRAQPLHLCSHARRAATHETNDTAVVLRRTISYETIQTDHTHFLLSFSSDFFKGDLLSYFFFKGPILYYMNVRTCECVCVKRECACKCGIFLKREMKKKSEKGYPVKSYVCRHLNLAISPLSRLYHHS